MTVSGPPDCHWVLPIGAGGPNGAAPLGLLLASSDG
ncbi:MAG: hypothetical protein QOH97_250 [Actinoplanes sp.]|jgi:hypothetical protein|nr:hypothetical protein [Actinoplanes sp.]